MTYVEIVDGVCVPGVQTSNYGVVVAAEILEEAQNESCMKGKFVCLTCKFNTHACEHTETLGNFMEDSEENLLLQDILYRKSVCTTSQRQNRQFSFKKIPFPAPKNSELRSISEFDREYFIMSGSFVGSIYNIDLPIICNACNATLNSLDMEFSLVPLYLRSSIVRCKVFQCLCNCGEMNFLDGLEIGAINMGSYMISQQILWEYHDAFVCGRMSFHAFYEALMLKFERGTSFQNLRLQLSYSKLKAAWNLFLRLLDIDFSTGFQCSICLKTPKVILCDGTTLAFKRKFLVSKNKIKSSEVKDIPIAKFNERLAIKNTKSRKLLEEFAAGNILVLNELLESLKTDNSEITQALSCLLGNLTQNTSCPKIYVDLFLSLSKDSAVVSLIPCKKNVFDLFNELLEGLEIKKQPEKFQFLSMECPVFFELISGLENDDIPIELLSLIKAIMKVSQRTYPGLDFTTTELEELPISCLKELPDQLEYFPSVPKLVERGLFPADKKNNLEEKSCEKNFKGRHSSLLPGIFTIYCEHGICYGFQVMERSESVNIPFTILRTRFHKSPEVIVYDFACGLQKYSLNRDPLFFRNTKFLIDRLHWKNHKGCSLGFCLDKYNQFKGLNTQINEQMNSYLKKIKHILSFMNEENFALHCKLYLYYYNTKKLKSFSKV